MKENLGTVEHGSEPSIRGPETWRYIDRCVQQGNADFSMYVDLKKRIHCMQCKSHYADYFNRNKHLNPLEFFNNLWNEIEERKGNLKERTIEEYAEYLGVTLSL